MPDIQDIVIGAGVVGLACARALADRGREVLVLERHAAAGMETTARNSGVIHAGIYYPPGSLRARLCVEGKQRLYRFCAENDVDAVRCGKLLVAVRDAEVARLDALAANARANGVDDLVMLTAREARELEPDIRCAAACLSPSTGIVDVHALVTALLGHVESRHGQVVFETRVTHIDLREHGFELAFESAGERDSVSCERLVVAAGHGAGDIVGPLAASRGYPMPRTRPARGHYYRLNAKHRFRHLVYPMPDGAWLGTHLTLDTGGAAKFGPDNEWIDHVDYAFDDSDARRERFYDEIRRYWPTVEPASLVPDYVGVRPKIYGPGEDVPDFAVHGTATHGIDNLVALFGIESPGLTSSLAIGDYVAGRLNEEIGA